jgi:uncharacterized phiE125 gp8 family phage protein
MALYLVTAPALEPVTVEEAKAHSRIDHSDDDALVASLIVAARQYVETYTQRALVTQTWDWKLDGFPCGAMTLPMPPTLSVTSITYLDTANVSQTWSAADYLTEFPVGEQAAPARITSDYGISYPSTYGVMNAVTIRFVAGYAATAEAAVIAIPASLKTVIKVLVAHWYEQRQPVLVGTTLVPVPTSVEALLWPYKVF